MDKQMNNRYRIIKQSLNNSLLRKTLFIFLALAMLVTIWQPSVAHAAPTIPSGFTDVTKSWGGKTVTLYSVQNGKYIATEINTSGVPLRARTATPGTWEQYQTTLTSDGWIGFRSVANSKYISARTDKSQTPLEATASALKSWECFRIYQNGSNLYLLSQANGKWVQANVDQANAPLRASATKPSTWERFKLNTVSTSTSSVPKSDPSGIKLGSLLINTGQTMKVSWDAVAGATKYRIRIYDTNGNQVQDYKDVTTTNTTTAAFASSGTYRIRVYAGNGAGWKEPGSYSANFTVQAQLLIPKTDPTGIKLEATTINTGQNMKVTWDSVSGATKYRVRVYDISGNQVQLYQDVLWNSMTTGSFSSPGIYRVQVYAGNNAGWKEPGSFSGYFVVVPYGFTDVTQQWGNKIVTIQSIQNGKFVATEKDTSGAPLRARSVAPGSLEQYQTTLTSDGWIGFRSVANNKFICVRIDKSPVSIEAVTDSIQGWERFRIYQNGTNLYLLSYASGKWVQANVDQSNAPLKASISNPSTWERFKLSDTLQNWKTWALDKVHWNSSTPEGYKGIDVDTAFGAQCADIGKSWAEYLGSPIGLLDGNDTAGQKNYWKGTNVSNLKSVQPGDIVSHVGGRQHVIVVLTAPDANGNFQVLEQNPESPHVSTYNANSTSGTIWRIVGPSLN